MLIYGKYIIVFCSVFQIGVEEYMYLIIYCKGGKKNVCDFF